MLGPLLFIVYINDLLDLNCDGLITCFADDTTILINDKNKDALVSKATRIMSDVNKWFSLNSLEINYEKTCCISFTISKKSSQIIDGIKIHHLNCFKVKSPNNDNFSCNCTNIKSVDSINYLGLTFDSI